MAIVFQFGYTSEGGELDMSHKLFIVGNGFDLARDLKTSYIDFFNWIDHRVFDSDEKEYEFHALQHFIGVRDFDYVESSLPELLNKNNESKINFWYFYLRLCAPINSNWSNVEYKIEETLEEIDSRKKIRPFSFPDNQVLQFTLEYYYPSFFSKTTYKNIEELFQNLLNDLYSFEDTFNTYISKEVLPNITHESSIEHFLSQTISHDDLISVLNFNYTPFLESYKNYRNIHGSVSSKEEIIFGIDSTKIKPDSLLYIFTKASRLMRNSPNNTSSAILNTDITDINFVGHSLNKADYAYFQSVFDYLSIYDKPVTLNFYSTKYHKLYNNMSEYQLAINALLSEYGDTMPNKAQGDNLISKLLLEGRLNLIDTSL